MLANVIEMLHHGGHALVHLAGNGVNVTCTFGQIVLLPVQGHGSQQAQQRDRCCHKHPLGQCVLHEVRIFRKGSRSHGLAGNEHDDVVEITVHLLLVGLGTERRDALSCCTSVLLQARRPSGSFFHLHGLHEMGANRFGIDGKNAHLRQSDHGVWPGAIRETDLLIVVDVLAETGQFKQTTQRDLTPVAPCLGRPCQCR